MRIPNRAGRWSLGPLRDAVLVIAVLAFVAVAAAWLDPAAAPLSGIGRVIDGDTLRIGPTRVRLLGLDAPELDQSCTDAKGVDWACGSDARQFLRELLRKGGLTCFPSGRDRYGRVLARCAVTGDDIGARIVAAGWAVADADYLGQQILARTGGKGIWIGRFDDPVEWRRTHIRDDPSLLDWLRTWFR